MELIPVCTNCGEKILTMCFQGELYCSDNCKKELKRKRKRTARK